MPQLTSTHATTARKRSIVWIYWAAITALLVVSGFTHPMGFLTAVATGLYTRYLYRGGSLVFWVW